MKQTNQIVPSFSSGRKSQFIVLALCIMLFSPFFWRGAGSEAHANAVNITNVGMGSVAGTLTFTITWANNWNVSQTPFNNDAVWVFVKYAACVSGVDPVWLHGALSNVSSDHSVSSGNFMVQAANDGMGVFIRRTLLSVTLPVTAGPFNVTLKLNITGASTYNFRVFGVEMVNIPVNNFYVGDGASASAFTSRWVNNADENTTGIAVNALGSNAAIPTTYPVGYNGFYCMKYEISQQQYVDFLNTLTYDQQAAHTAIAPNSAQGAGTATLTSYAMMPGGTIASAPNPTRNGIRILSSGVSNTKPAQYFNDLNGDGVVNTSASSTDGLNVAANYLSWSDLAAYLDWAALRPMSEMEYEKICRGTNTAVAKEYAWGTGLNSTTAAGGSCIGSTRWMGAAFGTMGCGQLPTCYPSIDPVNTGNLLAGTSGMNTETAAATDPGYDGLAANTTAVGCACIGGTGPLRVGFASKAGTTSRGQAGAGYYGVMDLSGNVWERTVSTNSDGVIFNGDSLGNGTLPATGFSDVGTWPDGTTGVNAAKGSGFRGGSFASTATETYGAAATNYDFTVYGGSAVASWAYGRPNTMYGYPRLRTSDRNNAVTVDPARVSDYGGRGVR